ncbi:beta-glucan synthesis-associated [Syncephalis fuscata]|nr:beta-glucan synthesis-associated [Syncephalis fuscata]
MEDGTEYQLVFSDEFNKDGRDFRPGKDKIWEAMDLHYWQTEDYERYTPEQASTKDGKLRIKVENKKVGDQNYASAMLQTWNNFCFRGGYLEASVSLPGNPMVPALWPAIWTMGNLGRAGYGGSTDGLWPYSYDTCDIGCLCSDQDTPSPSVGRGAAELDLLEGAAGDNGVNGDEGNNGGGTISQSHQFAPFDAPNYIVQENYVAIYNTSTTYKNSYKGGHLQQAISIKTKIAPQYYEGKDYLTYAMKYEPGPSGQATWWVDNNKKWSFSAQAVGPNSRSRIGQRVVSEEPMYLLMNVAMSDTFGKIDFGKAKFPATMYVDYIRIYQDPKKDRPTAKYIKDHPKLYTNLSIHNFKDSGYTMPTYSLDGQCKT